MLSGLQILGSKAYLRIILIFLGLFFPRDACAVHYYVSPGGSDTNTGNEDAPYKTIQKATSTAIAGDTIMVRSGQYDAIPSSYRFAHSGTAEKPIVFTNYPGEQVVIKITTADRNDRHGFRCVVHPKDPPSWSTPKADYIHIKGTDVPGTTLSNGIQSTKGIVIQGMEGEQSAGIWAGNCDHWEVSGVDFVEVSVGIFTQKYTWGENVERSTDNWHVHHNRVHTYYRESGMQFNGNHNIIEYNEIYKVSSRLDTPYGCQHLNLLGNNNIVRNNTFSRKGSTAMCLGLLFEWDLSDANLIEHNTFTEMPMGVSLQGGDRNIIRNNTFVATPGTAYAGIEIHSYDNKTTWPCNDYMGSGGSVEMIVPPNTPDHADFQYYYNPRNCHSMNNQIINNTVVGFPNIVHQSPVIESSNTINGNTTTSISSTPFPSSTPLLPSSTVLAGKPGDANGDGKVNGLDYAIWLHSYGKAVTCASVCADFNISGRLDGVDYIIWVMNYGK